MAPAHAMSLARVVERLALAEERRSPFPLTPGAEGSQGGSAMIAWTAEAMVLRPLALGLSLITLLAAAAVAQTPAAGGPVQNGSTVSLEYTLKDDGGQVLDSNKGGAPLVFVQGRRDIIAGLERELLGLRTGDERHIVVKPEDAYGAVVPNAEAEVPKEAIPEEGRKIGTTLMARSGGGEPRPVVVKEVRETTVVLDLKHPLAGKTLYFDVKVLDVQDPRPQ
jgi:FKBP-type peptidyl-prolyl cis-trans isomerase SlyD